VGNSVPAGYVEVRKGVYERRDVLKKRSLGGKAVLPAKNPDSKRKPKRPVCNEPLAKDAGEKTPTGRVLVRVSVFRKRLTDPCNCTQKYFVDALRYSGILEDDREEDIVLEVRQEKTRGQEETLIELFNESARSG
jgi:hypothetical protein